MTLAGVSRPRTESMSANRKFGSTSGVLAYQDLRYALENEWIRPTGLYGIPADESLQPASLDLRLGDEAYALKCSFLPDPGSTVEEKLRDIAFPDVIDLQRGATLHTNRPYLIPLIEELRLPDEIRGKANPKSSTGRLDVFTRVITDRNYRFDEIAAGYHGRLYLEVVPRSFAINVKTGLALNQLRLMSGADTRLSDDDVRQLHLRTPLLYADSKPVSDSRLALADGLFLSVDLSSTPESVAGFRAKESAPPVDLSRTHAYDWEDYWEPIRPNSKRQIILQPEAFYLLLSSEGVCIPPDYSAEMMAYDPTAGELRTHYAGFFDPGFGYDSRPKRRGSRAALEVRARDVAFMVEHEQRICKLAFERMAATPDVLYGEALASNYQGQNTMLSKHFRDQTAGLGQLSLRSVTNPLLTAAHAQD